MSKCMVYTCCGHFIVSGLIIVLLILPIDFKANNAHSRIQNASEDSLTQHMMVHQLLNYLIAVPSPHMDVTEEELVRVWHLPPGTQLSPTMRAVGRCRITLDRVHSEYGIAVCHRIEVKWSGMTLVLALINFFSFFLMYHMVDVGQWTRDVPGVWKMKVKCGVVMSLLNAISSFVVMAAFVKMDRRFTQDAGLSYTPMGQIFPIGYFEPPIEWYVVLVLCLINYLLSVIQFGSFLAVTRQPTLIDLLEKEENRQMKRDRKERWEQAEKRFTENNSGVPPKMLLQVIRYVKADNPTTGYMILEDATPFSPVFINAVKKFKK